MLQRGRTVATVLAGPTGLGLLARWAPPGPALALLGVWPPTPGTSAEDLLTAAVVLGAWAGTAWLCLAVLLAALARAPGATGAAARSAAGRLLPPALRRLSEALLGATLLGVTAGGAGLAGPAYAETGGAPSVGFPRLDWPASGAARAAGPDRPEPPPGSEGQPPEGAPPARPDAAGPSSAVLVRAGDSLWAISRRSLPPGARAAQVAAAWPRWYAANRSVIGPDPDLLLPGQRLFPPP